MKKYIYITPYFPNPHWHSGIYSYDFVKALERNSDYDVSVYVPGAGSDYTFKDVVVHHFPTWGFPTGILPTSFSRHNAKSFVKALLSAGIDIADTACVHVNFEWHGVYALALKRLNPGILTVMQHHDLSPFGMRLGRFRHVWLHKVINFFALRKIHEQIDLHVFISEASRRSMLVFPDTSWSVFDDYRRLSRGMSHFRPAVLRDSLVVHNGVDTRLFRPCSRPVDRGHIFTIGCVANFIEVKDNLLLIKAVELLAKRGINITLRFKGISGFGQFLSQCQTYVQKRGLQQIVSFEPNCSHDELPEFYRSIDLFVMPSFFEGFGCVYTEAWACGTPFIACEGQGIADVIPLSERKYWLCKPRCLEDLAAKIEYYITNRPVQKLSKPIDIDCIVREYVDYIAEKCSSEGAKDASR